MGQKGLVPIFVIIVVVALVGGVAIFSLTRSDKTPIETSTPSPAATVTPTDTASPSATTTSTPKPTSAALIDCVGPDGKTAKKTKKDCDAFLKAWASPTPKATASPSMTSNSSSGGCEIGQANIGISADNGPVVGDALITITVNSSSCASTYNNYKILSQGSSSVNFSGILPGSYNIKVNYHGRDFNDSFDMSNAGNVSKTVGVSN